MNKFDNPITSRNVSALSYDDKFDMIGSRSSLDKNSILIFLFVLSLSIPMFFYIGTLRLTFYRLILLLFFFPAFFSWITGKLDGVRTPDVLVFLSALWAAFSLLLHHGFDEGLEPAGIWVVETFGGYILARMLIRDMRSFVFFVTVLFWLIVAMVPLAVFEALTDRPIVLDALRPFVQTFHNSQMDPRWGLERAQVVFEHPILFGAFCASAIGLVYYVKGHGSQIVVRLARVGVPIFAAVLSLSTGALASVVAQFTLTGWELTTRSVPRRWAILGLMVGGAYFVIDVLSNRTPFHVLVTYLTFSSHSAYNRILIFKYGSAEVMRHPIFGIGHNSWERASFMSGSMDNFWLVIAVTYGLPAFLLLALAIVLIMKRSGAAAAPNSAFLACQRGYLISLAGMIIAGGTVHYWNAVFTHFMFLLGAGVWMFDPTPDGPSEDRPVEKKKIKTVI